MAMRIPRALMDELVEEILLRIPPDDPARLVRASIACKRWCRLVRDPGFRRRFRERHRTPPLLGVIRYCHARGRVGFTRFIPTYSFRPRRADRHGWRAIDCRHGRVLLCSERWSSRSTFAVWDPVTDAQRELPALPPYPYLHSSNAAVLCAGRGGCNHLDCHSGPFLVVFVGVHSAGTFASMYSSEADAWGEPTSAQHSDVLDGYLRGAHVGNALYFVVLPLQELIMARILEYDLVTGKMTLTDSPPMENFVIVLTILESGGLGCITSNGSALYLWSRVAGPDRDMRWVQSKLIEYKIPVGYTMIKLDVFGSADGGGVIYVGTDDGAFTTDLKSGRCMKVGGGIGGGETVVPFMSFYTPGGSLEWIEQGIHDGCAHVAGMASYVQVGDEGRTGDNHTAGGVGSTLSASDWMDCGFVTVGSIKCSAFGGLWKCDQSAV